MRKFLSSWFNETLLSGDQPNERLNVAIDPELSRKLGSTVDILGQMNVSEYTPIVAQKPLPGLSFLRDKLVGGDTEFSVTGGEIRIDGGLGLRSLYTKDYGLYMPGLLGLAGIRVRMETPNTGTYRYGYGNDSGTRVGLESVNGSWTTFVESEGVRWYAKPRAEWLDPLDGTGPSGISADLNGATLRIILGWYGGISLLFSVIVADRDGGDRLVVFDSSGSKPNGVTIDQPDLPIFAEANGGVIYVGGRQYGVFGRFRPQFRVATSRTSTKSISTASITPIVSMRGKSAQRWQSVPLSLAGETVLSQVDAEFVLILGGTLTGATFGAMDGIDPEETALEVDTSATAITGGYRTLSGIVAGGGGRNFGETEKSLPDVNIPAGVVVTLAAISLSGTGDITGILRMRELW